MHRLWIYYGKVIIAGGRACMYTRRLATIVTGYTDRLLD